MPSLSACTTSSTIRSLLLRLVWTLFLVVSVPVYVCDVHHCSITEMYCRVCFKSSHCDMTPLLGTYCLLDVCVLPGTWHHLLSAYVLHNEQWEIVTHNTFSGHPEGAIYTGFPCIWLTQNLQATPFAAYEAIKIQINCLQSIWDLNKPIVKLSYTHTPLPSLF